jgi:hypothetical protein
LFIFVRKSEKRWVMMDIKIPEDKWFYFASGKKAASIEELKNVLEHTGEAEFRHHVYDGRNDFASWIEGVFGETKLGHELREIVDKDGTIIMLEDFLEGKRKKEAPKKIDAPKEEVKAEERMEARAKEAFEAPEISSRSIIPEERKLKAEPEKELSEKEIKSLVNEAVEVFEQEYDAHKKKQVLDAPLISDDLDEDAMGEGDEEKAGQEDEFGEKPLRKPFEKAYEPGSAAVPEHTHKFIVAEFIYGFILGLIFGMIMLGILFNLKFA